MTTTVYVNDVLRGELEPYHLWNLVPTPKVIGSGKENARRTWWLDQHTGRNQKLYVNIRQVVLQGGREKQFPSLHSKIKDNWRTGNHQSAPRYCPSNHLNLLTLLDLRTS